MLVGINIFYVLLRKCFVTFQREKLTLQII
jgi:hypothetical protein